MVNFEFQKQFDGTPPEVPETEKLQVRTAFDATVEANLTRYQDEVRSADFRDDPSTSRLSSRRLPLYAQLEDGSGVDVDISKYDYAEPPHAYIDIKSPDGRTSRYMRDVVTDDVIRIDSREAPKSSSAVRLGKTTLRSMSEEEPELPKDILAITDVQEIVRAEAEFLIAQQNAGFNGQPINMEEMKSLGRLVENSVPRQTEWTD